MTPEQIAILEIAKEQAIFAGKTTGGWSLTRAEPRKYVAARNLGASNRQYEHGYDLKEVVDRVTQRNRMSIPRS